MRRLLFFVILLASDLNTQGQNLIANPSFEIINYCEANIPCSPSAWHSVSNIPYGYQNDLSKTVDGKHSLAFLIACEKEVRFYWQTMLLCSLRNDQKYNLEFEVYSPNVKFDARYFGVHFSDTFFQSLNDTLMRMEENQYKRAENIGKLKKGWSKVKVSFIATGKEKYLLLGNLDTISNKEILKNENSHPKFIEYYIDNLTLKANDKSIAKCPSYDSRKDSLLALNIRHAFTERTKLIDSFQTSSTLSIVPGTDTIILGNINFNFNNAELINTETLKHYFDGLLPTEIVKIEIIGYTDSIGSKTYNLKLSERRALSVKSYLTNVLNLPGNLILTIGKGIVNDNRILKYNRRVEVIITKR